MASTCFGGVEEKDNVPMPDIKFTSSVSTLLLRVSLPSLGLDSVLTFEVGLGKSLNHVQEVIESLVEDVSSELHDEIQEECPNADPHQFKSFFCFRRDKATGMASPAETG